MRSHPMCPHHYILWHNRWGWRHIRHYWASQFPARGSIDPPSMAEPLWLGTSYTTAGDGWWGRRLLAEPRSSVTSWVKRRAREGVSRSSVEPWLAPCRGREVRLLLNWPRWSDSYSLAHYTYQSYHGKSFYYLSILPLPIILFPFC